MVWTNDFFVDTLWHEKIRLISVFSLENGVFQDVFGLYTLYTLDHMVSFDLNTLFRKENKIKLSTMN